MINSEPLHCLATQEVLALYGVTMSEADYFGRYIVYSDWEIMELLLSDAPARPAAVQAKSRRYLELVGAGIPPFPDGLQLLMRTDGWRVALATGSMRHEAELALGSLGVRDRFQAIVTREDCVNGKPEPGAVSAGGCRARRPADAVRGDRGFTRWDPSGQGGWDGLCGRDPLLSPRHIAGSGSGGGRFGERGPSDGAARYAGLLMLDEAIRKRVNAVLAPLRVVYGAMVGSILVYWIVVQVIRKVGQIPRGRDTFAAVDWMRYPLYAPRHRGLRRHPPDAASTVRPGRPDPRAHGRSLPEVLSVLSSNQILVFAVAEVPVILGLALYFVGGYLLGFLRASRRLRPGVRHGLSVREGVGRALSQIRASRPELFASSGS